MDPLDVEILRLLALVKILDAAVRQLQGISQIGGSLIPGLMQLCRRDLKRLRPEPIELLGERHHCLIPVVAHLLEDRFHSGGRVLLG